MKRNAFGILIFSILIVYVRPHGRLIEPPSRSTMWRYGFSTPPNYNDHELYCGGFTRQWRTNGGKCGICGDPWDTKTPRANEAGGLYGKGVIVRKYEKNTVMKVRVELTANHMGYFEFRVCPNNNLLNNPAKAASQKCLDQYRLTIASTGHPKFYPGPGNRVFELHYQLPKDLTCRQCVFQWRYVAGNNWGTCSNGTEAVGCGPQEEFRACADITITEPDGTADETPNTLVDDAVFVPPSDSSSDYHDVDNNDIEDYADNNNVNDDNEDVNNDDLRKEVEVESVIIIVLATLLFSLLFFGLLIFYYARGKTYLRNFAIDRDISMPSIGKLPAVTIPKAFKNATSNLNWPLSSVQIKKLPSFLKKKNSISKVESALSRTRAANITSPVPNTETCSSVPRPPPRAKKATSQITAVRVATIAPRQHQSGRPPPHPTSAPPPPPPPPHLTSSPAAVLEIGSPMAVTINGVTVSPMAKVDACSPMADKGFIVPAKLALAHDDIPDSMEHMKTHPPPLPISPPPDDDEDYTEA